MEKSIKIDNLGVPPMHDSGNLQIIIYWFNQVSS